MKLKIGSKYHLNYGSQREVRGGNGRISICLTDLLLTQMFSGHSDPKFARKEEEEDEEFYTLKSIYRSWRILTHISLLWLWRKVIVI